MLSMFCFIIDFTGWFCSYSSFNILFYYISLTFVLKKKIAFTFYHNLLRFLITNSSISSIYTVLTLSMECVCVRREAGGDHVLFCFVFFIVQHFVPQCFCMKSALQIKPDWLIPAPPTNLFQDKWAACRQACRIWSSASFTFPKWSFIEPQAPSNSFTGRAQAFLTPTVCADHHRRVYKRLLAEGRGTDSIFCTVRETERHMWTVSGV